MRHLSGFEARRPRSRALRAAAFALLLGGGMELVSPVVHAQSQEDLERARSLFRQGLSLEAAGNWAAALSKFDEVGKVKLSAQVRFHTARCNEQLGRLNEALGGYRLAEYEAGQQGLADLPAITQSRQALESRIPKLVIQRGHGAETAHIELDGVALGEAQIGKAFAVDPGPHTVVAKLGGDRQFQQSVVVKESETAKVDLVAPDEATPVPNRPVTGTSEDTEGDHNAGVAPAAKASPVPWIIGGVGVAALGAAGAFYLVRQGDKNDLDKGCHGNICPESLSSKQSQGQLFGTLSAVSLGVGVVGIGVATYLLVKGPPKAASSEQAFIPVDVLATQHGGAVTVRGRF